LSVSGEATIEPVQRRAKSMSAAYQFKQWGFEVGNFGWSSGRLVGFGETVMVPNLSCHVRQRRRWHGEADRSELVDLIA
jgi:hypothetical protein